MLDKIKELFFYGIFGILTTLINIFVYKLLIDLNVNYAIGTTIAFIISILFAFFTNRKFVFNSKAKKLNDILNEMLRFFTARISTYFIDLFGLIFLVQVISVDKFMSKIIMNFIVIILNYILSKKAVFQSS